jgi:hypothetical protein
MNVQRWVLASVVVTVVVAVMEMIIHGVILAPLYQQTASVWRPHEESQAVMPLMWLGYAIFAPFFVWIYVQGMEAGKDAIGQGIRFGLMFGIGLSAMGAIIWYVVLPIPQKLAFAWFLAGTAVYTAAGAAAALTYKEEPQPQAERQPAKRAPAKRRRRSAV